VSPVFVDTGAFAALADRNDRHHREARRLLRRLARERRTLVTSTYVVDELLTVVRMRVGQAAAVRIGERLMQTRWCRIVEVSEDMRDAAWQLFVRYHDHVFSFTDCTSFALMRAMSLEEAFTFDRGDFATAGLTTLV
jgi:predicted nucleic acid-binding protein